jgi:hypothetical protein
MHWRSCLRGSLGRLVAAAALLLGCSEGHFPVCHTNTDCQARDAGKSGGNVCYNLRCVECRYDTDCPAGKICGSTATCEGLGGQAGSKGCDKDDTPAWEPANWDECAKKCKDQACLSQCDARFHPK